MSIPLSSTTAMFSFTKVENWRNVNFLPKCTRLRLKFQHFPRVIPPDHHRWGHHCQDPTPARRFAPQLVAFGHSMVPWQSHTFWNKSKARMDKESKSTLINRFKPKCVQNRVNFYHITKKVVLEDIWRKETWSLMDFSRWKRTSQRVSYENDSDTEISVRSEN